MIMIVPRSPVHYCLNCAYFNVFHVAVADVILILFTVCWECNFLGMLNATARDMERITSVA